MAAGNEGDKDVTGLPWMLALSQALGVVMIVLTGIWLNNYLGGFGWAGGSKEFNVHPLCMVCGMVFLYGEGMMVYRVFRKTPKLTVKVIHAVLLFLAFIAIIIGLVAVFQFHNHSGITNMYSLHSWCGIAAVVLFALQLTLGFLCFLFPGARQSMKSFYLPLHQFWGGAIFVFSGISCISGINEKLFFLGAGTYAALPAKAVLGNVLGLVIVAFMFCVLFIVQREDWKRPTAGEEEALSVQFQRLTSGGTDGE